MQGCLFLTNYLRNDAVPEVTLRRAKFEYCARARARCAAAVSTADMLRNPAVKTKKKKKIVKNNVHFFSTSVQDTKKIGRNKRVINNL